MISNYKGEKRQQIKGLETNVGISARIHIDLSEKVCKPLPSAIRDFANMFTGGIFSKTAFEN